VASVNRGKFLKDDTGNRRFLAFAIEWANGLHKVDMNRVYAQAYALLHQPDFKYWFDDIDAQTKLLNDINEEFREKSEEEEYIEEVFEKPVKPYGANVNWVSSAYIADTLNKLYPRITAKVVNVGKYLTRKDFDVKTGHGSKKLYAVIQRVFPGERYGG
jgi:hypothetical protein